MAITDHPRRSVGSKAPDAVGSESDSGGGLVRDLPAASVAAAVADGDRTAARPAMPGCAKVLHSGLRPCHGRVRVMTVAWARTDLWRRGPWVLDRPGAPRSFPKSAPAVVCSRFIVAMMTTSQVIGVLLVCTWPLLGQKLGGISRTILWDRDSGMGQGGPAAPEVASWCGKPAVRFVRIRMKQ